jgi:hypothetical protein
MAQIFADTFETGDFSAWSWTTVNGTGASLTVAGAAARAGSYGMIAEGLTGGQNWNAYPVRTITPPASNVIHARFWLNIQTVTAGGGLRIFRFNGSGLFNLFRIADYYGSWNAYLRRKDGDTETISISGGIPTAQWVKFDVLYDVSGANPNLKVWQDNAEIINFTDMTAGTTGMPDELQIGGSEEAWSQTATLWFDDVALWDDANNIPTAAAVAAPRLMLLGAG